MQDHISQFFECLNKQSISYCVFKGVYHLKESQIPSGIENDIDLFVPAKKQKKFFEVANQFGFMKSRLPISIGPITFMYMFDDQTNKIYTLNIFNKLVLGDKKIKPYRLSQEQAILQRSIMHHKHPIRIIHPVDDLCIQIALLSANGWSEKKAKRILQLIKSTKTPIQTADDTKPIILSEETYEELCASTSITNLKNKLKKNEADIGRTLQTYRTTARTVRAHLNWAILRGSEAFARITKLLPRYIFKRGALVALIGVDGSGKSTQIEQLTQHPLLFHHGIKNIYFGQNNYWMPGLNALLKHANSGKAAKISRKTIYTLGIIDRRLRVLKALAAKAMGFIVICDRYYFDDIVHYQSLPKDQKSIARAIAYGWIGIYPDITFYLKINAKNAYQRKQDYDFQTMVETVSNYNKVLPEQKNVIVLDAMNDKAEITSTIYKKIYNLCAL